ncbi:MAG: S-layer homology domain-containing protein [Propioniciclava sp.]|uniref:S-layer homology domain-containing protein n=1 Tax=Propioniciclava sp. TaxID=2038686 RepID=UPI0039E266CA
MKHIVRALGVGLATMGLLAATAPGALAAPSYTPVNPGDVVKARPVSLAEASSAGQKNRVALASADAGVYADVFPFCADVEGGGLQGGVEWEVTNDTDAAGWAKVAVTRINERPQAWETVNAESGQTVQAAVAIQDAATVRVWAETSTGEDWDTMLSLPDCIGGDPFTDSDYFEDQFGMEIDWMAQTGLSTGWDEGDGTHTYRGLQPMNRNAMAAFLYRLANKPDFTPPAKQTFTDVTPSSPFYKEIEWLASTGISTGWAEAGGKRTFRPYTSVNRDAMAAFLYRFAGEPDFGFEPGYVWFDDVPEGTEHFVAMAWMAETGISTGWDTGAELPEYRPWNSVNRDAIAAFIFRLVDAASRPE